MDTTLNWTKLYATGRCKAIGIHWTDEERNAVFILRIPAEYVREGVITLEDYQKALREEADTGKKPLERREMSELLELAEKFEIKISPDVTKGVLVEEIKKRALLAKARAEQQEAVKKAYSSHEKEQAKAQAEAEKAREKAKKEMEEKEKTDNAKAQAEAEKASQK